MEIVIKVISFMAIMILTQLELFPSFFLPLLPYLS